MPTFDSDVWLPRPPEEIFAFFEDPRNLEALTPPWLHFRILRPAPDRMEKGTFVHYLLRIRGIPVWWGTLITRHEPPHVFTDRQLWGPYLVWVHTHTFEPEGTGTRVRDHVRYQHLGGRWVERRVRRDLEEIFAYRRKELARRFP